jgi:HD superfamily phosphodiesterase
MGTLVAEAELAVSLSQRWAHSQGVARHAAELAAVLGNDAGMLASAAILHDAGHAPWALSIMHFRVSFSTKPRFSYRAATRGNRALALADPGDRTIHREVSQAI